MMISRFSTPKLKKNAVEELISLWKLLDDQMNTLRVIANV